MMVGADSGLVQANDGVHPTLAGRAALRGAVVDGIEACVAQ